MFPGFLLQGVQHQRGMRVGGTGTHFRCYPDRLHEFLWRGTGPPCRFGVRLDAIGALRGVCHCDGNDLLHLGGQRAVAEHGFVEGVERRLSGGRKLAALLRHLTGNRGYILLGIPFSCRFDVALSAQTINWHDQRTRQLHRRWKTCIDDIAIWTDNKRRMEIT